MNKYGIIHEAVYMLGIQEMLGYCNGSRLLDMHI